MMLCLNLHEIPWSILVALIGILFNLFCSDFTFKFSGTKYCGNALIVRDVTAEGLVSSTGGKVSWN